MLPTKNYEHIFNFVKVINRNSVSFSTSDTIERLFYDVIITSARYSDMGM